MCEFCSFGPNTNHDRDSTDFQFAGFFSADAIEAAVQQANASRRRGSGSSDGEDDENVGDDDSDGT